MLRKIHYLLLTIALLLTLAACGSTESAASAAGQLTETDAVAEVLVSAETNPAPQADAASDDVARPAGWSDATHSNDVDPNYDVVFPEDSVNTLTITIDSADWQAMLDNMTELYGEAGSGSFGPPGAAADGVTPANGMPPGPPPNFDLSEILPEGCELPDGFVPRPDVEWPAGCEPDPSALPQPPGGMPGMAGGGPGGGPPADLGVSENPDYAPATVEFEGDVWTNVGIRFKGNSTLMSGWSSGSVELPFKLDFDEFEDDYPEIDNQRFYGFKQLSLANNTRDTTYMRNALAYDLFDNVGLAAPATAWYELIVDYGEGPVSFGLYTVVEVVDDSVIERAFGGDDGNIYEGDGAGASLADGTFDQIADGFQKENNDEADYSDLEALYNVLHDDLRLSDAAAWRTELEALFDVDTFLNWLAVNTVITNWDTYGTMWHNFYLYNNPDTGQLTWIPWDYNESMQAGGMGAGGATKSLSLSEVGDDWPLIRYLLDDAAYYERYVDAVATAAAAYDADALAEKLASWEALLAPYAAAEGNTTFADTVAELVAYAYERAAAVETFLAEQ